MVGGALVEGLVSGEMKQALKVVGNLAGVPVMKRGLTIRGKRMGNEATFYRRVEEWLSRLLELNPVAATELGGHRWDDRLADNTLEALESQHREIQAALAEVQAMEAAGFSPDARIDHSLIVHILKSFVRNFEKKQSHLRNPGVYLEETLMNKIFLLRVRILMRLALITLAIMMGISLVIGCSANRLLPASPSSTFTPSPRPTATLVPSFPTPSHTLSLKPLPSPLASEVRLLSILDLSLSLPGYDRDFDWSPDGQALVLASGKSASGSLDYNLLVARAPDFTPQRLTAQDGHQPRWSPDGEWIAFVSRRQTDNHQPETIWLVRADGSDLRDLLPGERAIRSVSGAKYLDLWLDEKTLIFADPCGTGCKRLAALDTVTGETQDFSVSGARYRWSPSRDKYIAIEGGGVPQTSLWERTNSGSWRETPLPRPGEFYAWSPDGKVFLFSHWPWKPGQGPPYAVTSHVPALYVWDVAQSQAQELFSGVYRGAWSPDGERIAFFLLGEPVYDEERRLWGTDLVPGEPFAPSLAIWDVPSERVVVAMTFQEQMDVAEHVEVGLQDWFAVRQPVWSPDGQYLIYWGEGYDRSDYWWLDAGGDIWIVDRDGKQQRRLTHGLKVVNVVWSPDGGKLAFATAHQLYVIRRP